VITQKGSEPANFLLETRLRTASNLNHIKHRNTL
jgi:hypothetical protein